MEAKKAVEKEGVIEAGKDSGKKGESMSAPSAWQVDIGTMAGNLVHEIKNPLSTLKLNTELLIEEWKNPQQPKEFRTVRRLNTMLTELKRLEEIIHSFLNFTRKHELRLEFVSINEVLEHIIELVREACEKQGIVVRTSLDPNLPNTLADPSLLQQAFMNLVTNAQEAMPGGGDLIIKSRVDGPWIVVDFIDTGIGIAPNNLEKIFNLYFSTKENGNGLGLAYCQRIVQEHGGSMQVQSELGKGSQFTVRLPIRTESELYEEE